MNTTIRIATRKSPLALWQAQLVQAQLQAQHPDRQFQLVPLTTQGDKQIDLPLTHIGGKALFVKTLQEALLQHEADLAVHSIKDMSVHATPGLTLAAITQREDPRDVFISPQYTALSSLPKGAVIGTASPRRQCFLAHYFPHLTTQLLRGNINTRLEKCQSQAYDGIILAAAGVKRLAFEKVICEYLDPTEFIPAIGQGALGIECRADDLAIQTLVHPLHDAPTAQCVEAERAVNRTLNGDCHTPLGAHATLIDDQIYLRAALGDLSTGALWQTQAQGDPHQATQIGTEVGKKLLHCSNKKGFE